VVLVQLFVLIVRFQRVWTGAGCLRAVRETRAKEMVDTYTELIAHGPISARHL